MADQLVFNNIIQNTAQACVVDLTPPVFAGITGLVANADGSLTASWAAATDSNPPINYEVYIQAGTATGLFSSGNLVTSVRTLNATIFTLANGAPLQYGVTYFVGVRARDALNNVENNLVSLSEQSLGVANRASIYKVHSVFSIGADNTLAGSFWLTADDNFVDFDLTSASYTLYDKDGNTIGITESGITPDVDGFFRITPVSAIAIQDLTHYIAVINIVHNAQTFEAAKGITLGE